MPPRTSSGSHWARGAWHAVCTAVSVPRSAQVQVPGHPHPELGPRHPEPDLGVWGPHGDIRPCPLAPALFSSPAKADDGKEQLTYESGEDGEDEEEDFKPSDGSENEMETEILDYV